MSPPNQRRSYAGGALATKLSLDLLAAGTSATVVAGSTLPTATFHIVIDEGLPAEEKCFCTSRVGNVLAITRGEDGSVAQGHLAGADVRHVMVAQDPDEANLLVSRSQPMTAAARAALAGAELFDGRLVYETDTKRLVIYNATAVAWRGVRPVVFASNSGATQTTAAGAELTLAPTLTIPDQGHVGNILVNANFWIAKTVVTDVFLARLKYGASVAMQNRNDDGADATVQYNLQGIVGQAAGASTAITCSLQRLSGTGTATPDAANTVIINALWIPTP